MSACSPDSSSWSRLDFISSPVQLILGEVLEEQSQVHQQQHQQSLDELLEFGIDLFPCTRTGNGTHTRTHVEGEVLAATAAKEEKRVGKLLQHVSILSNVFLGPQQPSKSLTDSSTSTSTSSPLPEEMGVEYNEEMSLHQDYRLERV
jgi:hypothetical protein